MGYYPTQTGVPHKFVIPTSGSTSITTASANWANLSTHVASFTDITLAGVSAGDVLEITIAGYWSSEVQTALLDVATIVSGSIVNLVSTGTSTPGTGGVRQWQGAASSVTTFGSPYQYTVQAGDLSATSVTLRPRVKTAGARTLFHDPGRFAVKNLGPSQG